MAIPTVQRDLSATASALQWIVDSYVLVFAGLLMTMGALGDRFGRARALVTGLVIFGVGSAYAAFTSSATELIWARAVMGVGGALIMPATLSIITDVFPREERGRAIGVWAAVAGLGIGIGPVVGGLLLENFWWGSVFLVNVPIVLIALIAGYFLVPASRDPEATPLDLPGAATSMVTVSALVFGIIEGPARGWTSGLVLSAFVVAAAAGVAFWAIERRTEHPMLDLDYFKNPRFSGGAAAISIAFFALFGVIFLLTQFLQFVQGYTALEAGLRTAPVAIGMVIGSATSPRLAERFGTARVVAFGLGVLAAVLFSYTAFGIDDRGDGLRDGQHHGAIHRCRHGGRTCGKGRRCVGHQRCHPAGRRRDWRGSDRLRLQFRVLGQRERRPRRAATTGRRGSRQLDRRCDPGRGEPAR